jgi:hypothetical protein
MGRKRKNRNKNNNHQSKRICIEQVKEERIQPIAFMNLSDDVQSFVLTFLPLFYRLKTLVYVNKHVHSLVYESAKEGNIVGCSPDTKEDFQFTEANHYIEFANNPIIYQNTYCWYSKVMFKLSQQVIDKIDYSMFINLKCFIADQFNLKLHHLPVYESILDALPNIECIQIPKLNQRLTNKFIVKNSLKMLILTNCGMTEEFASVIRNRFPNLEALELSANSSYRQFFKTLFADNSSLKALTFTGYPIDSLKDIISEIVSSNNATQFRHIGFNNTWNRTIETFNPLIDLVEKHSLRSIEFGYCQNLHAEDLETLLDMNCTVSIATACHDFREIGCPCVYKGFYDHIHSFMISRHDDHEILMSDCRRLQKKYNKLFVIQNIEPYNIPWPIFQRINGLMKLLQ